MKIPQGDGGGAKIRSQVNWLKHVGARRGTAGWLCRKREGWVLSAQVENTARRSGDIDGVAENLRAQGGGLSAR